MAEMDKNATKATEDEGVKTDSSAETSATNSDKGTENLTVEQLMLQLAQARAEAKKWKAANDKTSSEVATLKKENRELKTADQIAKDEEREAAEAQKAEIEELKLFKRKAEAKARYAIQGMPEDLASQAAEYEVQGDFDGLAAVQKTFQQNLIKANDAKWIKERPGIQSGNSEGVTKEQFETMSFAERTKLLRNNPELYHRLLGR